MIPGFYMFDKGIEKQYPLCWSILQRNLGHEEKRWEFPSIRPPALIPPSPFLPLIPSHPPSFFPLLFFLLPRSPALSSLPHPLCVLLLLLLCFFSYC